MAENAKGGAPVLAFMVGGLLVAVAAMGLYLYDAGAPPRPASTVTVSVPALPSPAALPRPPTLPNPQPLPAPVPTPSPVQ